MTHPTDPFDFPAPDDDGLVVVVAPRIDWVKLLEWIEHAHDRSPLDGIRYAIACGLEDDEK